MSADLRAGDGGQIGQFGQLKKADPRADLRARLEAMRAQIVAAMVRDGFSAGLGAILAQLAAALDALDKALQNAAEHGNADPLFFNTREAETTNSAAFSLPAIGPERAVVADDSEAIRLTLYGPAGALGSVTLDPVRAVGLARDLLAAAHPRLARTHIDLSHNGKRT